MLPDGTPAPATLARAAATADLARAHPDAAIICSGSHGVGRKPRRSEATRALLAGIAPGEVARMVAKLRSRH
jgi:hypothetical protein